MAGKTANWKPGPTVCRCCLAEGCYKDISTEYFWMGKREVYAEMLTNTFNVSIAFSQSGGPNSNSRLICEPCISRLRDASNFKRQVLDCEKTFMQHLDPGSSLSHQDLPEELAGLDDAVKVERVKIERDAPSDDDFDATPDFLDDDDDELDQPLTNFATKEPKKEAVSLLEELLDNPAVTIKKKSVVKTKQPPAKKVKRTETAKPTSSKVVVKTATAEKKKKDSSRYSVSSQIPKNKGKVSGISDKAIMKKTGEKDFLVKKNVYFILKCWKNIYPFKYYKSGYKCCYCNALFSESDEFRSHVGKCMKKYDLKDMYKNYAEMALVNVDVSEGVCRYCAEPFTDVKTMRDHVTRHGFEFNADQPDGVMPFRLDDGFKCFICKQKFRSFLILYKHMNIHYQLFVCSVCGKGFSETLKLRRHSVLHTEGDFPCNECDQVFTTWAARTYHKVTKHPPAERRYMCPVCDERFHYYAQRKKHLKETKCGDDSFSKKGKIYTCDVCGIKETRLASMNRHKKYFHYVNCPVCDRTFKHRRLLNAHRAKMHAGYVEKDTESEDEEWSEYED